MLSDILACHGGFRPLFKSFVIFLIYYDGIIGNLRLSYELYCRTSVISTTYITNVNPKR
jgi:hypothetical protein